ncbi:MAG TPA: hypothetical protein VIV12_15835, partial [Streptosporangiaceae bacterium]
MTVIAGVDVGNATTEVAVVAGNRLLGTGRLPTRGRKGSPESLRAAAALVRRIERSLGCRVTEARIAPLRAVDTTTLTIPHAPAPAGRLRLLAASASTPGGTGAFVGVPLWLDRPPGAGWAAGDRRPPPGRSPVAGGPQPSPGPLSAAAADSSTVLRAVAVVPASLGYAQAAERLRALLAAGVQIGAVLVAADEGVLISNRLPARLPVVDEVDLAAMAACVLVAVEVRAPGRPLSLVADPVALAAAFSLTNDEVTAAAAFCRSLVDRSNAVVGYTSQAGTGQAGTGQAGTGPLPGPDLPWLAVGGERVSLTLASARMAGWPVGAVRAFSTGQAHTEVDDLFAVDLDAVADIATARRGSLGQAFLVASLQRMQDTADHAGLLA